MIQIACSFIFILVFCSTSQAHWGHLGDLGGHSHWLVGAVIIAGILAGLAGLAGQVANGDKEEGDDEELDIEVEGQSA